jgi:putative Ca2+/H+ antiporter (TMEM165/GDT1 family)
MTASFLVSTVVVAVAEIGDKTQIATVVLAAQYHALVAVVLGTTLGMLIANVPVVLLGNALAGRLQLRAIRICAALVFAVLGVLALAGTGAAPE